MADSKVETSKPTLAPAISDSNAETCDSESNDSEDDGSDYVPSDDDIPKSTVSSTAKSKFLELVREGLLKQRAEPMKKYSERTDRSKRGNVAIAQEVLDLSCKILAYDESEAHLVRTDVLRRYGCNTAETESEQYRWMAGIACDYRTAQDKSEKIFILGLMASKCRYIDAVQHIPDLTEYAFYNAKRIHAEYSESMKPIVPHIHVNYEKHKVLYFISFICSPVVTIGLPFGVQRVKTDSCGTVEVPNTVRALRNAHVVKLYNSYLKENNAEDMALSDRTLTRILKWCPATSQLMHACINYFIADGEEVIVQFSNKNRKCRKLNTQL